MRLKLRPVLGYLCGVLALIATTGSVSAAACGTGLNPIVVAATAVAFGLYSPGAASGATSNGTVTVACTTPVGATLPDFTIALSAGTTGQFAPRRLTFGGATLNYNIYTSPSFVTVWGDGSGATLTQPYASGAALASTTFTAYGLVPPHQFVAAGMYTDAITVTVTY
jgi:spore coat protein U-like protein